MQNQTFLSVMALLRADATIDPRNRARMLAMLRRGPDAQTDAQTPRTGPRVMQRAEAAAALGRTVRHIDHLARAGLLRRVRLPGRVRACGVRAEDVATLVESCTVEAGKGGAQ